MAEIQTNQATNKKNRRRSKKQSTKVDLTPMVDLGFLLITFFVFTTSLSRPTAMKLTLPNNDSKDSMEAAAGKTISLLLTGNDQIYYYNGDSIANIHSTNYSAAGIRTVIANKKAFVQKKYGNAGETIVLIKPTINAAYRNIVDALDEMQINMVTRYVLAEASENESAFIAAAR